VHRRSRGESRRRYDLVSTLNALEQFCCFLLIRQVVTCEQAHDDVGVDEGCGHG